MKRQKLIDDIQKFIDKKRRKYFIIKLQRVKKGISIRYNDEVYKSFTQFFSKN